MDLLVRLYSLPDKPDERSPETLVRRAFAAEKHLVSEFAAKSFTRGWASECEAAFARQPVACFIAITANKICGFACYDATARGFFGPIGVAEKYRNRSVGSRLLCSALQDMRANGYAYAVIGGVSDARFYRSIDAIEIPNSTPGFYSGMFRDKTPS